MSTQLARTIRTFWLVTMVAMLPAYFLIGYLLSRTARLYDLLDRTLTLVERLSAICK